MPDYQPIHRYEHFNILHQFLHTTLILMPTLANTTPSLTTTRFVAWAWPTKSSAFLWGHVKAKNVDKRTTLTANHGVHRPH